MKISRHLGFLLGVLVPMQLMASPHSTRWTLRNEGKETMRMSCRNMSAGVMDIRLPEQTIGAGREMVHDWGDRYYNDGLWLNPGQWNCLVQTAGRAARTETFTTDWGEAITLILNVHENQVRLRKLPGHAPLATKALPAPVKESQ